MAFLPVPTYADVVVVDQKTKKGSFNPVWLSWFLNLTNGGLGATIAHNTLAGLQGGGGNERYHLSATEFNNIVLRSHAPTFTIPVTASPFVYLNGGGYSVQVIFTGGIITATEFSRDGTTWIAYSPTSGLTLSPGDSLRTTYTTAPTMTGIPQ